MGGPGKSGNGRWRLFSLLALAALLGSLVLPLANVSAVQAADPVEAAEPGLKTVPTLPLAFEQNAGQTDPQVRYLVHAPRAVLHFTPTDLVLMLAESAGAGGASRSDPDHASARAAAAPRAVRMSFVGANNATQIVGQKPLPGVVNYLLGADPSKWVTQVPTYGEIVYQNLYPGVDLSYDGQTGQLKGSYILEPGADPSQIRWRYQGGDRTSVTTAGALQVQVANVTVTEHAPLAWQEQGSQRTTVSVAYDLASDGSIGFQLGAYDPNLPLVIDPTLTYATFLGGTAGDEARGVAVDGGGNMYIAGYTASTDFPTVNPVQGNPPADDAFVTKLNTSGSAVVYSTYLGGSAADRAWAMALDGAGNVYLTGFTESTDFPTTAGAYDRTRGGTGAAGVDAFVTKLNASGSALVFSTFLGGSTCTITGTTPEWGFAIGVDASNLVYVAGLTLCSDFPTTPNAYRGSAGGLEDAFVSKFSADGSALLYSTYLGGAQLDWAEALAVSGGQVYVTGRTLSDNFPTKNAFQASKNASIDAFVAKLNTTASGNASLVYSTYLGGPGAEKSYGLDIDAAGNVFVAGMTDAAGFPTTPGAFRTTFSGGGACPDGDSAGDAYIAKLNPTGAELIYSTYLGGSGCDAARDVEVDGAGNAYVVGWTDSANFPLAAPIQATRGGGEDVFVSKLNAAGSALVYSTYLGGSNHDYARSLVVDGAGVAYVVGQAQSNNFPTTGNALFPNRGAGDAFIAKIASDATPPPPALPRTWYFAEGYTGPGFDEYLTIQNPNAQAGTATITYYLEGAAPVGRQVPLPPTSRTTVQVHNPASPSNPGGYGRTAPGQGISAKVEATLGVIVERPMYFTYAGGIKGGHNVMGANAPRQSWLFGEGYTGPGFDEFLTIMNPNSTAAAVTITYFLGSGAPVTKQLTVPGSRRHTVIVHETAEGVGRNQAVSARVTTTNPGGIVVERPMYFNYGGWSQGGHNVMGAAETHTTWFFPDGDTRTGADTYLTIMNPTATNAQVTLTYYTGGGATVVKNIQAPANRRYTVLVYEAAEGVGRGKTPGIKVTSTNGVGLVVERPIYKTVGGDDVLGAAQTRPNWLFAEGWTGAGFSESLVLLNPNNSAAPVTITYYLAGGSTVVKSLSVEARSRRVVDVNGTSEGVGPNQAVSAKVSTTLAGGIVAERSMTFNYVGSIPGYHAVLGFAP